LTPTTHTKEVILHNHRSVLCSFGIAIKVEEMDLSSLYWIPILHKCPYKQRYIDCCVEGIQVKCFNAIAEGEGPRLYVL
jgi:hypothetical protein